MVDELRTFTITQLSEETGVHPSTIKYYIAEGLLPRGRLLARNRALYGSTHVERLRMLRALVTVGNVSIAQLRRIVAAMDGDSMTAMLAAVQDSVPAAGSDQEPSPERLDQIRNLFHMDPTSPLRNHPSIAAAATAVESAEPFLGDGLEEWLSQLIIGATTAASADLKVLGQMPTREAAIECAAIGTALGDVILLHARRIAQSMITTGEYGPGPRR